MPGSRRGKAHKCADDGDLLLINVAMTLFVMLLLFIC